jgi:hypothetical protein
MELSRNENIRQESSLIDGPERLGSITRNIRKNERPNSEIDEGFDDFRGGNNNGKLGEISGYGSGVAKAPNFQPIEPPSILDNLRRGPHFQHKQPSSGYYHPETQSTTTAYSGHSGHNGHTHSRAPYIHHELPSPRYKLAEECNHCRRYNKKVCDCHIPIELQMPPQRHQPKHYPINDCESCRLGIRH